MINFFVITQFAKKEFLDKLHNFFIIKLTVLLLLLNFFLLYFSDVFYLKADEIDYRSIFLSIIHLQMYSIPFFSLLLSYDSILRERELGILNLFLTYPFNYVNVLYGKLIGYFLVLILSFLIGFIPIFVYFVGGFAFVFSSFFFLCCCFWLSFVFVAIGIIISMFFKDRTLVIFYSFFCWLFFTFLYDFIFVILLILCDGFITKTYSNYLMLFNPVEIFKISSVLLLIPTEANDIFGIDFTVFSTFFLLCVMFFWVIIPVITLLRLCLIFNKKNKYVK